MAQAHPENLSSTCLLGCVCEVDVDVAIQEVLEIWVEVAEMDDPWATAAILQ